MGQDSTTKNGDRLKVKTVPIDSIHHDQENPRTHDARNLKAIEGSLDRWGQVEPLVVQKGSGKVIGGNGRLTALKEMGRDVVDVVEVDVNDQDAMALSVALNRTAELAGWDDTILATHLAELQNDVDYDHVLTGFDDKEIQRLIDEAFPKEVVEDEVPEDVEPRVKRGEVWELGAHRVMCGDATKKGDVERVMDGAKADVCVTDPPYGVLSESWDRPFDQADLDMILLHTGGLVACFNAARPSIVRDILLLAPAPERIGVWRHSHISPKPGMVWSWQPVFYWRCGGAVAWDSLDWYQGNADRDGSHPTQKPIAFFAKIIESVECNSVFDPFLGSGTTLIAAEQLGRRCYGLEIEPKYCDVILARWENLTGKKAERVP